MQKIHEGLEPQEFLSYEPGQSKTEEAVPQENPGAETPENTTDQNQETKPIDIQGNVTENRRIRRITSPQKTRKILRIPTITRTIRIQRQTRMTISSRKTRQRIQVITRTRIQRRIRVIIQTRHQQKIRMRIQIRIGQKRIHREIRQIQPGILRRVCSKTLAMMSEK